MVPSKPSRFFKRDPSFSEVIINGKMDAANYSAYSGYAHLGAGGFLAARAGGDLGANYVPFAGGFRGKPKGHPKSMLGFPSFTHLNVT